MIQTEEPTLARVLAAVREHRRGQADAGSGRFAAWRISSLAGGNNGHLYRCDAFGSPVCIKLCRVDERRRAEREWIGMNLLARRVGQLVPCPLGYDPGAGAPAVTMTLLPGSPMVGRELTMEQLRALAQTIQKLQVITPADAPDFQLPRVGGAREDAEWSVLRRVECVDATGLDDDQIAAYRPLRDLWLASDDRAILTADASAIFSRGDANLANWLWDGDQVRAVDFEYAGWSDRAWDLADLVEGIWARRTPDPRWAAFVDWFDLSLDERRRFLAARRALAVFWTLLLGQRQSPSALFWEQVARANDLLS
ncbi:MAG TPA: aminoglycoside phosphotransferase family protein [Chloroflexota bacterium]|nr:aminoglycoside phosphotransferase family protein [Chloroflexota bacterium]